MRLVFPGTGGFHPNERRHTACVLLPECGVALDAGTGFFRAALRLQTRQLDVFLSHAHLDHVVGLPSILVPILRSELDAVRVHGTAATLDAVRGHLLHESLFPVPLPVEWCELSGPVMLTGGGRLSWTTLEHPGGSCGYRIDWADRSLAYITDTTAPGPYVEFVRGVSLLIHECYFPDDQSEWAVKTGHSTASAVARVARDAGVGRLLLVHVDPNRDDDDPVGIHSVRSIFPQSQVVEDLQEIEF
jgi:ribonuclease BN (tRNA processing enzyme)